MELNHIRGRAILGYSGLIILAAPSTVVVLSP